MPLRLGRRERALRRTRATRPIVIIVIIIVVVRRTRLLALAFHLALASIRLFARVDTRAHSRQLRPHLFALLTLTQRTLV
ncbi:MAG TPA: hypothetical protein VLD39_02100, partial [Gammaproteobacteria bacterium]|nr:hypothetical protein [Gammaproteobacteria bacterium]